MDNSYKKNKLRFVDNFQDIEGNFQEKMVMIIRKWNRQLKKKILYISPQMIASAVGF